MSRKITWLIIAVVLALVVTDIQPSATLAKAQPQWEYKVVYRVLGFEEKNFNELGADGWEFVAAETNSINGNSSRARYIFKRLK